MEDLLFKKESFYTNKEGTSLFELLLITSICYFSSLFCIFLNSFDKKFNFKYLETFVFCFFVIFSVIFSKLLFYVYFLVCFLFFIRRTKSKKHFSNSTNKISILRGSTTLLISICILAVDFQCFPRRFCKTKEKHISLMDMGISFVVFSMGLSFKKKNISLRKRIFCWIREVFFLFLIGLISLYFLPPKGYGEYGKNMNFFFIIAIIKTLTFLFYPLLDFSETLGCLFLFLNYLILYFFSIEKYVLGPSRGSFFSNNKEAFVISCGCFILFLLSNGVRKSLDSKNNKGLFIRFFLSLISFFLIRNKKQPARVVFNTSFCLFSYSIGLFHILILSFLEKMNFQFSFLQKISENQFFFFLTADILTGCIGKTINTFRIGKLFSIIILFSYILFTSVLCFNVFPWLRKSLLSFYN